MMLVDWAVSKGRGPLECLPSHAKSSQGAIMGLVEGPVQGFALGPLTVLYQHFLCGNWAELYPSLPSKFSTCVTKLGKA